MDNRSLFWAVAKVFGIVALLYFFICSLDLLSAAFKLLAGKGTSKSLKRGVADTFVLVEEGYGLTNLDLSRWPLRGRQLLVQSNGRYEA